MHTSSGQRNVIEPNPGSNDLTWNSQVRKTGLEFREFPLGIPGIPINFLKLALSFFKLAQYGFMTNLKRLYFEFEICTCMYNIENSRNFWNRAHLKVEFPMGIP